MNNNLAIETYNLSKSFKLRRGNGYIDALKDINISVKEGEIFGLIGPNGAGKTTLIQILSTLQQPSSGYAKIYDFNILKKSKEVKKLIGLMLGNEMLYYRITGYSNLKFFCKLYKIPNYKEKILNIAKEFELEKWLNQYVSSYSTGMKMKLSLSRILLIDPKILILDEPTLGLDVKSINFIVNKLKNLNKTIFITSHDLTSMDKLCDKIAFIQQGKIIKIGNKEEIKRLMQIKIKINIFISENREDLIQKLSTQDFISNIIEDKENITITINSRGDYPKLFAVLSKFNVLKIKEKELTLEDLFLDLLYHI